jgi:Ca2+-binding RTX toxin-like protein
MIIVDPRTAAVTVNGTAGGDVYAGSEYNGNVLNGGGGNDKLIGGSGTDQMNGGANTDTVSYEKSTAGIIVNLETKAGTGGYAAGDTYDSVENVVGSAFGDTLYGDVSNNYLAGLGGNDVLIGGSGADTLNGGAGDDVYHLTDAADTIVEAAGNGTDTAVASVSLSLNAYAYVENIMAAANAGGIQLIGSDTANTIIGNGANNSLHGEGGNDIIMGGAGADAMYGGSGNDTFYVDNTGDQVIGGSETDTVFTTVNFTLASDLEILTATGDAGLQLNGNGLANVITGNSGANRIYGGAGNDVLRGGAGKDVFVFDTKLNKNTNVDRVLDFRYQDDSFHLDNKYFTKLGSGSSSKPKKINSDMFAEGKKAQDREDRIIYDKKTGALYYDADGTGSKAQVKIATIDNKTKLFYHDFFVI